MTFSKFVCLLFLLPLIKNIVHLTALNSRVGEKLDNFKKYWKLFDIFLPCTFHFIRAPEAWLDMHDSFLERCRQLNYCMTIQTNSTLKLGNTTLAKVLQETWREIFVRNVTLAFRKLFSYNHYHEICTVRLAFRNQTGNNYTRAYEQGNGEGWLNLPSRNYIHFIVCKKNNKKPENILGPIIGKLKAPLLKQK